MEKVKGMISVVIPSFNRKKELPACLESVLGQTYGNIEVIVADDGSADGTEELFAGITDQRVKYLRYTPNRGACFARNYGAERSAGEYIAFQDSDDIWRPDKLEKQMEFMRETGADFVFCGMNRVSAGGKRYYYPVHDFVNGADPVGQLLLENRAGTQTMLMRREVWEDTRFDESFRRYQDWDFAMRAAKSHSTAYQKLALVDSEVSAGSISASVSSVPALQKLYEKHKDEFSGRPDCLAAYYRRLGNRFRLSEPREAAACYKKCIELEGRARDRVRYLSCVLRGAVPVKRP